MRGSSFTNDSKTARQISGESSVFFGMGFTGRYLSEELSSGHLQMLENRAEAQNGKERESADDEDGGDKERREERRGDGKGAGGFSDRFLLSKISGDGKNRNHRKEAAEKHGDGER